MSERKTRLCSVCRSEYKYCNQCKEDEKKPTWYFTFCSENCHDLYKIMSDFENGYISDIEAKEQLKDLDLSKQEQFGTSYKKSLKKIMSAKMKNVKKYDEPKVMVSEKVTDIVTHVNNEETVAIQVD